MYLVYIYIYPVYGYTEHSGYSVKKYIVMDALNHVDAKRKVIEKAKLSIDEISEKINEEKTKVIKLENNDGIITL